MSQHEKERLRYQTIRQSLYKGKGGFGPGMSVINERSKRCESNSTKR
jgi:hypothetical protein